MAGSPLEREQRVVRLHHNVGSVRRLVWEDAAQAEAKYKSGVGSRT